MRTPIRSAVLLVALLCCLPELGAAGSDWPMWRYDAHRSAASPDALPAELRLRWTVQLPSPRPAYPHDNRMRFDRTYEPVVMDKTIFVPSMVTDSVTAFDTETGQERWVFFADGPVRFAPVAWEGKVYFVSDDGFLYCVDSDTGSLLWRFTPVPPDERGRKLLGHERLISRWPARGGPVLADGVIYFAAGVFPFEGAYVCALRAETGEAVWMNDASAVIPDANQDHGGAWDAGLSPQGYLTIVGDKLAVASGRALPVLFDRRTGAMEPYSAGWGGRIALAKGSWYTASIGEYYFHSGDLYGPKPDILAEAPEVEDRVSLVQLARETGATMQTVQRWLDRLGLETFEVGGERFVPLQNRAGTHLYWTAGLPRRPHEQQVQEARPRLQIDPANDKYLGEFREPVLAPEAVYYSRGIDLWLEKAEEPRGEIVAFDIAKPVRWQRTYTTAAGSELTAWRTVAFDPLWRFPFDLTVHIKAGSRLYSGAAGRVAAVEIPEAGARPRLAWQAEIDGTPARMLAADGKLFVVTQEGAIHAFGAGEGEPQVPAPDSGPPTAPADEWTSQASQVLQQTGATEGFCLALGLGTGRLAEELARQSDLHVVVLEPDAEKVAEARRRFHAQGLYGTRIHAIPADLLSLELSPYWASLVVSEDPAGAAWERPAPLLEKLFACLRPYGGVACLPAPVHAEAARWVGEAQPAGAAMSEGGDFSLLTRAGALAESDDWTHEAGSAANTFTSADRRVKPPFGVLWFGGAFDRLEPGWRHVPRVSEGRMFIHSHDDLLALDIYTGRDLWKASGIFSPGFVAVEDGVYVFSEGSCLRLDPASGATLGQFDVPATSRGSRSWRAFRICGDHFVGTTGREFRFPEPFDFDFVGGAGEELICLDRRRGTVQWTFQPKRDGLCFALGAGTVYAVDYWLPAHRRRGEPKTEEATIYALDIADGQLRWQITVSTPAADKSESPFGRYQPLVPWLSYCAQSDLVVLTANWEILGAWLGKDGTARWTGEVPCADPPSRYSFPQPPIVLPDMLITHGGQMVDPQSGEVLPDRLWQGINTGTRGCNRALASPYVALLRDADTSYFNLADGRQTRLVGIRSGCTNALLPAGGVLSSPNLAYHCSCNWPIFTSMAMVHMPQAAAWPPAAATEDEE